MGIELHVLGNACAGEHAPGFTAMGSTNAKCWSIVFGKHSAGSGTKDPTKAHLVTLLGVGHDKDASQRYC